MGVRFRKSVKIAPGVKLNVGKSSAGVSFGGKGSHLSMNTSGRITTSAGVPGTGVSYVNQTGGSQKKKPRASGVIAVILIIFSVFAISSIFSGKDSKEQTAPQPGQSAVSEPNLTEQQLPPSDEDNESKAKEYLFDTFQLEMAEYKRDGSRLYISVSIPGVSDREDQSEAPENWDGIQRTMISAQARLKEELKVSNIAFMLFLVDSDGEPMLTVQNSRITQDRYKVDSEPEEQVNSSMKPSTTYVWVTETGKKYHYSSSCSGMNNPTSISIDSARSEGYTPCSKCA